LVCHLHERDRSLAVVDAGPGNDVGDRNAEVVCCQMNLIPYEPLYLALRVLLCSQ
jgi:hypothetical protein